MRNGLSAVAEALGVWHLTRRLTSQVPRIFMLHRFSPEPQARRMCADDFTRFIDRLAAEFELVTMQELSSRLDARHSVKRTLATVTVDDGYEDFYTVALPILKARRLPATIFTTAGFVDDKCWLWWDALRYLVDTQPDGLLRLELPEQTFALVLSDEVSRVAAWSEIADHLVKRNEARSLAFEQLEAASRVSLPSSPTTDFAPMSWAQLRVCEAAGIEIGGHTMTHAFLPTLNQQRLKHEVYDAKALLEQHLTNPVNSFAYPNGMFYDWTPRVERAVRDADFRIAVMAHPRRFNPDDRYRLGRWSVDPNGSQFDNILSGASILKMVLRSSWKRGDKGMVTKGGVDEDNALD